MKLNLILTKFLECAQLLFLYSQFLYFTETYIVGSSSLWRSTTVHYKRALFLY